MLWSREIALPRSAADITRCSHSDYKPYATTHNSNGKFVLSEWNFADLEKHIVFIIIILIIIIIINTKFETFVETILCMIVTWGGQWMTMYVRHVNLLALQFYI
jgi:hypothetical protein